MKIAIIFILLFSTLHLDAQTRTIEGRVTDEYLEIWPDVQILINDTVLIGKTDTAGRFKINIPTTIQSITFLAIGFETTPIKLINDCNTIDVVMMYDTRYHNYSSQKIDRLRLTRFHQLKNTHLKGFEKGIFKTKSAYYTTDFKPFKPELDNISKVMAQKRIQINTFFKSLNIGDTLKIPFSLHYKYDGTERNTLINYSYTVDGSNFDCLIKGVVEHKETKKKGLNISFKVSACDSCRAPIIYSGKELKAGDVLQYDMKYYKVLIK